MKENKEMKIYRLEVWAATDNQYKWAYHPLSDFYSDKDYLTKLKEEFENAYNEIDKKYPDEYQIMDLFNEWHKYLSSKCIEKGTEIYDTHAFMPEIREYTLKH